MVWDALRNRQLDIRVHAADQRPPLRLIQPPITALFDKK